MTQSETRNWAYKLAEHLEKNEGTKFYPGAKYTKALDLPSGLNSKRVIFNLEKHGYISGLVHAANGKDYSEFTIEQQLVDFYKQRKKENQDWWWRLAAIIVAATLAIIFGLRHWYK